MSIYFYHLKESNKVKIGYSKNIPQRIKTLNTAIHEEGNLIRVIEGYGYEAESWLHNYFKHLKVKGEWFTYSPEMLSIGLPKEISNPYLKYKDMDLSNGIWTSGGAQIQIFGNTPEERLNYLITNLAKINQIINQ